MPEVAYKDTYEEHHTSHGTFDIVKGLDKNVRNIKGDIKAIIEGFGVAQNCFNWGLTILGLLVVLIQLLK